MFMYWMLNQLVVALIFSLTTSNFN